MAYDYSDLVEKTKRWAAQACNSGWLNKESGQLENLDARTPNDLFNHSDARPLIVAFMGGTGVGKSSLLNRLAGKAIARTGIERPTSREVTLFHHRSVAIQHLPANLPLASITIAQHDDEAKKNIIWIDMPDFDSIEQSNKQLVLQWLPHIDVLIYVVSPERYKDEKAWRLLLAEGARHAWLFVLNQWDLGQAEQYEDFKLQLHKAGFVEPIIFRTACIEGGQADEFAALQATILSLATKNTIMELEQRSLEIRKNELKQKLQSYRRLLGSEPALQQMPGLWHEQWQHAANQLQQGFAWPIQQLASYYAEHAADLVTIPSTSRYSSAKTEAGLWDEWAQARFDDALDEFIISAGQLDIPVAPLKNQLAPLRRKAAKIIQTQSELAARQALVNPGNVLHRGFLKFVRLCEIVLPFAAICWVGYQVFIGYYRSNMSNVNYLGADFAIHSTLLIAITWLTPYFILKKLKPSLEKSALRGLHKGLTNAMSLIDSEVTQVLENTRHEHAEQVKQISAIMKHCEVTDSTRQLPTGSNTPLTRMLTS
ncbi:50S ribosome-binding GTPase [Candidatus Methylobacter favarea]|uniref:50S ribosome-binding GTPase n=1 Tax=Candidatus Methylobacter favarea TaxID=2707345 RepID=A0A8S0XK45_9GAMM|nr:GTPase [Candidatus Methylobacter favarea]CAA9891790.1 50S ribosome-binding GTPase [Candidatus Methylobacter favarea]